MPRVSGETQLKNATLELLLLPKNSNRVVTSVNVTNTIAALESAATLSLTSATPIPVLGGTSVSFLDGSQRKQALILDDINLTSSPLVVNISPLTDAISANVVAPLIGGLIPLFGIQGFNFGAQPQEVDTTNTQSGFGMESALVRSDKTLDISGIQIPGDRALYAIVKQVADSGAFFGREIYAVFTYPDGEIRRGAAKIKNYQEPGTQNEIKKYSFQVQFQGNGYERFASFIY